MLDRVDSFFFNIARILFYLLITVFFVSQVGTQVTNSAALQQQQLVATSASAGAVGMPGMSPNPYLGMTNPLQQQQMQFQLLQQQQQQQQMMMGGYHHPVASTMAMGASTGGAGSVQRIKTEELVTSLQALLVEYEKHSSSGGGSSGGGSAADVAAAKVFFHFITCL